MKIKQFIKGYPFIFALIVVFLAIGVVNLFVDWRIAVIELVAVLIDIGKYHTHGKAAQTASEEAVQQKRVLDLSLDNS